MSVYCGVAFHYNLDAKVPIGTYVNFDINFSQREYQMQFQLIEAEDETFFFSEALSHPVWLPDCWLSLARLFCPGVSVPHLAVD